MPVLLSTAYFPPISYFAAMAREFVLPPLQQNRLLEPVPAVVYIEACENYQKQSYRNRCHFYSASGMQPLSYPVVHKDGTHRIPIREIGIDWSTPWLQQHKRAIVSAYRTSAYFEYYQDELFDIMDRKPEKLFDFNLSILRFFIEKTGIGVDLRLTDEYVQDYHPGCCQDNLRSRLGVSGIICRDLREAIHPKRPDTILEDLNLKKPYFQVFAQKHGFISNLSIMDLLFNEGPDSILYLKGPLLQRSI